MTDLEVRFVVEGLDVDDGAQVCALYDNFDAVAAQIAGNVTVTLTLQAGERRMTDLQEAVALLERATGAIVIDVDLDLVDAGEIAQRTGMSRQGVSLLANGKRAEEFPVPYALPGGHRVWTWASVNTWLAEHRPDLADPVEHLTRQEQRALASWLTTHDQADHRRLQHAR